MPWPETTMQGYPQISAMRPRSRATQIPESELSTTVARHLRLEPSMTRRVRDRRPHESKSKLKFALNHWLIPCGIGIGARIPIARYGRRDGETCSFSSQ